MPISCACPGCGKRFKAPDAGAGKRIPCPNCKTAIQIPNLPAEDDYRLAEPEPSAVRKPASPPTSAAAGNAPPAQRPQVQPAPVPCPAKLPASHPASVQPAEKQPAVAAAPRSQPAGWVPTSRSSTPEWLRHLHWCLALAMIPLMISIMLPGESKEDFVNRLTESIQEAAPGPSAATATNSPPTPQTTPQPGITPSDSTSPSEETQSTSEEANIDWGNLDLNGLLMLLPGHKLKGALLARDSAVHWLFAVISSLLFLTFLVFLASDRSAQPLHLLGLALFTATGGIALLFLVQMLAGWGGIPRVRGRGGAIIALIMLLLLFIGLSYSMALDEDVGIIGSFFGFTFGVGLCEEICKALPLLVFYHFDNKQSWRGAFLWGLASGTGFGISEGVMYSQDFYNGISGSWIYVVRFISCVALHAIWSGSVGISINQRQHLLKDEETEGWPSYLLNVLILIAVPMVLHGLYDTLLKKDLSFFALVTAAVSFAYLAWQISNLRTSDDEDERAAYVANYIRQKGTAG